MTDMPPMPPAAPTPPGTPGGAPQNGMGTASIVMAVLQFVCLGPIASILAIIFGRIGMNKAKQGLATNGGLAKAGFWLGIVGLILTVIGGIIAALVIGFGVKAVTDSVDPVKNSQTGLADGNYDMNPNVSTFLNQRCSFGGSPVNTDTGESPAGSVTVVGEGTAECGVGMETPDVVVFTVTSGVARIVEVR